MLEKMKDAGCATGTAGMIQNKVKALRQAYIRAKDAVNRTGPSPEDALKKCPFFVEIDKFMGTRPIASPSNVV